MSNTRRSATGEAIGDPNLDLDYVAQLGGVATSAESEPGPETLFIEKYKWVPHWKGEATLALKGLELAVEDASQFKLSAVSRVIDRAQQYKNQALGELTYLRFALADPEELDSVGASLIRGDISVLTVLASHQLYASALTEGHWPSHQRTSIQKRLRKGIQDISATGDENLLMLWHGAFKSASERGKFWIDQLGRVQNHPRVIESRREAQHRLARR